MCAEDPFFRRYSLNRNSGSKWKRWLGAILGLAALGILIYKVPFVNHRLAWRLEALKTNIIYFFNPPEEVIFVPLAQGEVMATASALALTPHPSSTPQPATPQATDQPLPSSVFLQGVTFVTEQGRWNYCGPANLTMALKYWGWQGDRDDVGSVVKPGENNPNMDFIERGKSDKNVMPYEMENFVNEQTEFRALTRIGGETQLLKKLIANGFPVLVEKGYYTADYRGIVDWLGHYMFVTGYDDAKGAFIVQDAWDKYHPGENVDSPYQDFIEGWRSFNYLFIVVYPPDRKDEVVGLLGPWADAEWANRHALDIAAQEAEELDGIDQFFAWFNTGSSHVALYEYVDAANAYDWAFNLYNQLDEPPYRMMWYQTWPYWAYYYSGRYQEVINLANTTFNQAVVHKSTPTFEESFYWRGMAYNALGETDNAIDDFRQAVYLNPNFSPGLAMLTQLGVSP